MNILELRATLSQWVEARLTPDNISILSDDCWGGSFYRGKHIPYLTPLAGIFVPQADYLNFLENLRRPDAFTIIEAYSIDPEHNDEPIDHPYPVLKTRYTSFHCMHSDSIPNSIKTFNRRSQRINWDRLFIKIDFGKSKYTDRDIQRWNELKLPNSIAIVPDTKQFKNKEILNSVYIPEWEVDGGRMFHISRRHFDFPYWIKTGILRFNLVSNILQMMVIDPMSPSLFKQSIKHKVLGRQHKKVECRY
jgi:uncharacterized protein (DUF1919 family)